MKQGDYVIIKNDTVRHEIPIGTVVQIFSVTDDEFQAYYNGRWRYLDEDDMAEYEHIVEYQSCKLSIFERLILFLSSLCKFVLIAIALFLQNTSTKISNHAKKLNVNDQKVKA